jgi:NitT/TauT family transport system permease protein
MTRTHRGALLLACQVALLAAVLGAWQALVTGGAISVLFFGSPAVIAQRIFAWFASGSIFPHLAITLVETLLSFAVGASMALVLGLWLALTPFLGEVLDPFIKAVNSMPRLILAPIFAIWFGLGIWSKVALGVTLVFFVVFFNVVQGIREVSPILIANARMLGANKFQVVRRVYVPSAMSWVFSSLHTSIGLAFIGAVIGEYLGSSKGIGYLILQAEGTFDTNTVIAGIVVLTAFALTLDALITALERKILVWRPAPA